jgi:hypothetical protein
VFLDSDSFGAWAVPLAGKYYVAVTGGTLVSIIDYFARVFSVWNVSDGPWAVKDPDLSKVSVESHPLEAWRVKPEIPNDPVVRIRATILARQTFNFIVDHELAHIALGHCDFVHKTLGRQRVDAAIGVVDEIAALTSQAFELQADRFAVLLSLDDVFGLPSSERFLARIAMASPVDHQDAPAYERYASQIRQALRGLNDTQEQRIFVSLLTFFSMFRLFDQHHWSQQELRRSTHPPSPMRIAFAFQAASRFFGEFRPEAASAFENVVTRLRTTGELIFAQALARAPNGTAIERALSAEGMQHYERLLAHLDLVRPNLRVKYRSPKMSWDQLRTLPPAKSFK